MSDPLYICDHAGECPDNGCPHYVAHTIYGPFPDCGYRWCRVILNPVRCVPVGEEGEGDG
jgi:hypothetical protein